MTDAERQDLLDQEHLRLLRVGYLIVGGTNAVCSIFPLFYIGMGSFFAAALKDAPVRPGAPDPRAFIWIFAFFGTMFFLYLAVSAALKLFTARALRLRRYRTLCHLTAALTCLGIPYGTALGIFTFTVLARPSVAALFDGATFSPAGFVPPPMPPMPPIA